MAQVDYFLKIDGIPGEATDDRHKKEIDVLSWNLGVTNQGTSAYAGGLGAGKAVFHDFQFVMKTSAATPKLLEACATGAHIKEATLVCRKAGGGQLEYLIYKFTEGLVISSFQTGGHGGDDVIPTESITFNYAKIEVEYKEQDTNTGQLNKGSIKAGYNLKLNKKV